LLPDSRSRSRSNCYSSNQKRTWHTYVEEVINCRFAHRFMPWDYVPIRKQERNGQTVSTFTTAKRARLKSAPAKVTCRNDSCAVMGKPGVPRSLQCRSKLTTGLGYQRSWTLRRRWRQRQLRPATSCQGQSLLRSLRRTGAVGVATPGDSGVPTGERLPRANTRSRAFDVNGNLQPAPDDPLLASQRTYWESNGQITRRVFIP
jgi:hypothetical protein